MILLCALSSFLFLLFLLLFLLYLCLNSLIFFINTLRLVVVFTRTHIAEILLDVIDNFLVLIKVLISPSKGLLQHIVQDILKFVFSFVVHLTDVSEHILRLKASWIVGCDAKVIFL